MPRRYYQRRWHGGFTVRPAVEAICIHLHIANRRPDLYQHKRPWISVIQIFATVILRFRQSCLCRLLQCATTRSQSSPNRLGPRRTLAIPLSASGPLLIELPQELVNPLGDLLEQHVSKKLS